jgi:hypothetical protein
MAANWSHVRRLSVKQARQTYFNLENVFNRNKKLVLP